ncbi:MAG: F0F1 ATP synthase subunit B family protein [Polyangiales bacterium]
MKREGLLDRLRRWLATRPGRMVLVGATGAAVMMISAVASAQEHHEPAHPGGPAAGPNVHVAGEQPGAGQEEGEHGGAHGEAVHHPEPFNFADLNRYREEKAKEARGDKDAHGNPIAPVVPYAYLLVNFAILAFIYYRTGKKPIVDGLASRADEIAKELIEAKKIKDDALARAKEYEDRLASLETELEKVKGEIVKSGEADRERIVKEAEEKAERLRKDAQFMLDQEMKQLRNDMLAFTVEAATNAAEQVLKSKVSAADQDRLADEFLKQLSSMPKGKTVGGAS